MSYRGTKLSEETKEKIRLANLGKKRTLETRKRISIAKKGRSFINAGSFKKGHLSWNKGKSPSKETRDKISTTLKLRNAFREKNPNWKGGRTIKQGGYILNYRPNHPHANNGYVPEHRGIAEKALGRYLKSNEVVHHINGNPSDNRNINLMICTLGYHLWLHRKIKKLRRKNDIT